MAMQEFPLKMSGAPAGALQYAAFSDAAPSDAAETLELADWLFGRGQFPKLDDVDMELLGAEVCFLVSGFLLMLLEYEHSRTWLSGICVNGI
jgi:hypothetical protein